jgi:hypothetical protein
MRLLDVVNEVLIRLREPAVATVAVSDYTRLLAVYVADFDRKVGSAWKWTTTRRSISITTEPGVVSYELPNTTMLTIPRFAFNKTRKGTVKVIPFDELTKRYQAGTAPTGSVSGYGYNGVNPLTDNLMVDVWPIPSAVEELTFQVAGGYPRPLTDEDPIMVPPHVVSLGVTAKALLERGDEPTQVAVALEEYTSALNTAIAVDIERTPGEVDWVPQ